MSRKEQKRKALNDLCNLELKLKFDPSWNGIIRDLYQRLEVYTFEDLVNKDLVQAECLVISFKD
jgi:hypothetical protein